MLPKKGRLKLNSCCFWKAEVGSSINQDTSPLSPAVMHCSLKNIFSCETENTENTGKLFFFLYSMYNVFGQLGRSCIAGLDAQSKSFPDELSGDNSWQMSNLQWKEGLCWFQNELCQHFVPTLIFCLRSAIISEEVTPDLELAPG